MRIEEIDLDQWTRALPDSGYEVFHRPEALRVLSAHSDADLRLYGAFKGQEPVGLFPAFVDKKAGGKIVTSPPTGMVVPRLGPLLMPTSPKQRKRESVNREFADLLLDTVDADARRSLVRFACPLAFDDPRPFQWAEMDVGQSFTYVLDLDGRSEEDVLSSFSRDLRKEIRQADSTDVEISVEGDSAAGRVYEDVAQRYDEQGETFPADRAYFRDLVDGLEEYSRVYVARDADGSYLGGIVVLYSDDHAAFWQGGVSTSYDGISVNSCLHWRIVSDILEGDAPQDVSGYDLVGANTPRLSRYKAKFGADLVPYYTVESSGAEMSLAKRAYSLVNK
jgi:hypothetical protein